MILGVIADDFTGGTDIASFLVKEGMSVIQVIGAELDAKLREKCCQADAVVVSLKSRSCPVQEAVEQSLAALRMLQECSAQQIFFKYCSTFDCTAEGNIAPVTAALMQAMQVGFTVFSPALPVNGREVFNGYLMVKGELLSESPMKNHPLNPMHDSKVERLITMQQTYNNFKFHCGLISHRELQGDDCLRQVLRKIEQLSSEGCNCAVVDAISDHDLFVQGRSLIDMPLVTGGSGLGMGLARAHLERRKLSTVCKAVNAVGNAAIACANSLNEAKHNGMGSCADERKVVNTSCPKCAQKAEHENAGYPVQGLAVVLSGSCSAMTNRQVALYKQYASAWAVDIAECIGEKRAQYASQVASWYEQHKDEPLPPLVYATADPEKLHQIQSQYGAAASAQAIELFFHDLSIQLFAAGVRKFVVAGGETSGQVTRALGVSGFYIGPAIAPGVPWVKALNADLSLALKSGNFGAEDFFIHALGDF